MTPSPWQVSQRPPLTLKEKRPGLIAAGLGFGQAGEPVADGGEGARIGGGVRARGAADGRLVDVDDLVEMFHAIDAVMLGGRLAGAHELAGQRPVDRVDEQGGFAAAGDAGDAGEDAQRDFGGDILEIVGAGALDADGAVLLPLAAVMGDAAPAAGRARYCPVRRGGIGHDLFGAFPAPRCGRRSRRRRGRYRRRNRPA